MMLLALSVPMVLVGVYIAYLGTELFLRERRRELGMLKVRGATTKQVKELLANEAILLGAIAGICGHFLSMVAVSIFMRFTQAADYMSGKWIILDLSITNMFLAVLMGMFLMLGSTFRPFRRISGLEASELLANYSRTEERTGYKPNRDLVVLYVAFLLVFMLPYLDIVEEGLKYSDIFILEIIGPFISEVIIPAVILGSPYIFVFTMTRLFTRMSTRPYGKLVRLTDRISGNLRSIVHKNVTGGKRRITSVTSVLTICMAFLVFTSTFYYAERDREEEVIVAEVGGDIQIIMDNNMDFDGIIEYRSILGNLEGVEGVSVIQYFYYSSSGYWYRPNVILIDAKNYSAMVNTDLDGMWMDGEHGDFRDLEEGKEQVFITKWFYEDTHEGVGEDRSIPIYSTNSSFGSRNLAIAKVAGIVRTMPGNFRNEGWSDHREKRTIIADFEWYRTLLESFVRDNPGYPFKMVTSNDVKTRFMIKVQEGEDHERIAGAIASQSEEFGIDEIRVAESEIHDINHKAPAGSSLLLLRSEMMIMVFFSILAAAIIVYIAALERMNEMASIQLKGTTRKQLLQLQLGESITILTYSVMVGIFIGFMGALAWIYVFNFYDGMSLIINRSFFPSLSQLPAIGAMVLAAILVSYSNACMFMRTNLAKFIKLRSG